MATVISDDVAEEHVHDVGARNIPDILRSLHRMSMNGKRTKPIYSDC